jgi:hypothetical protein
MQSHLGSVVLCLISTCVVGFKVFQNFYANCGESVQPLQSVKLIDESCSRSRVLFRGELRSGVLHRLREVLRHAINQLDVCGRWRWSRVFIIIVIRVKTFESTLVSVIKFYNPFLYVLSNVLWYYTHLSIICVKLWSWHTYEMHSVFFEKTGVTRFRKASSGSPPPCPCMGAWAHARGCCSARM